MRLKNIKKGYSFDDVMLVPQSSWVESRKDVCLNTKVGKHNMLLPIMSANMDTVTGVDMAEIMALNGAIGVLHRFDSPANRAQSCAVLFHKYLNSDLTPFGFAVGLSDSLDWINGIVDTIKPAYLVLDVAHGDHQRVKQFLQKLVRIKGSNTSIVAGNIVTQMAAIDLIEAGADVLKVGVGPGSHCTTRNETGHGYPQLSAIEEVLEGVRLVNRPGISIIADGGITKTGDIVKALAVGADAVMIGNMFAGTDEAPGEIIERDGHLFKHYRGSASFDAKRSAGMDTRNIEGVESLVPYKGSVQRIINKIADGLRSGFSYSGARNIDELRKHAKFIEVTSPGKP